MLTNLNVATAGENKVWREMTPRNWAVMGQGSTLLKSSIDTYLSSHSVIDYNNSEFIFLINIGAGDYGTSETTYKANLVYTINALLAKFPKAIIYLPNGQWDRNTDTWQPALRGWTDDVIALYPGQCFAGHKENIWKEGGDNGATMTTDGGHYSVAGNNECAAQWYAIFDAAGWF